MLGYHENINIVYQRDIKDVNKLVAFCAGQQDIELQKLSAYLCYSAFSVSDWWLTLTKSEVFRVEVTQWQALFACPSYLPTKL